MDHVSTCIILDVVCRAVNNASECSAIDVVNNAMPAMDVDQSAMDACNAMAVDTGQQCYEYLERCHESPCDVADGVDTAFIVEIVE